MLKTYHGSCHCGAVRFEADIDLAQETLRCNCTVCLKARFWGAVVKPSSFRLLKGEQGLGEYRYLSRRDGHYFCKECGIRTFSTGESPRWGAFYAVSVTSLDDATEAELAAAPVTYLDGRHDIWDTPPAETRHL